jgi:hypothetical protein
MQRKCRGYTIDIGRIDSDPLDSVGVMNGAYKHGQGALR